MVEPILDGINQNRIVVLRMPCHVQIDFAVDIFGHELLLSLNASSRHQDDYESLDAMDPPYSVNMQEIA
jgi:hypothetical protein